VVGDALKVAELVEPGDDAGGEARLAAADLARTGADCRAASVNSTEAGGVRGGGATPSLSTRTGAGCRAAPVNYRIGGMRKKRAAQR
jgi:hypothetical protein